MKRKGRKRKRRRVIPPSSSSSLSRSGDGFLTLAYAYDLPVVAGLPPRLPSEGIVSEGSIPDVELLVGCVFKCPSVFSRAVDTNCSDMFCDSDSRAAVIVFIHFRSPALATNAPPTPRPRPIVAFRGVYIVLVLGCDVLLVVICIVYKCE